MRTSASSIKGMKQSRLQAKPREGSRLRKYYDRAVSGEWFDFVGETQTNRAGLLEALRISYELEFISRAHPDRTPAQRALRQFKCIGMWHGVTLRSLEDVEVALEHTPKDPTLWASSQ